MGGNEINPREYCGDKNIFVKSVCYVTECTVVIVETERVYCAVRTESLNIIQVNVLLQNVN
jgi:hypothetical protein